MQERQWPKFSRQESKIRLLKTYPGPLIGTAGEYIQFLLTSQKVKLRIAALFKKHISYHFRLPIQTQLVATGFMALNNLLQEKGQKTRKQIKVQKKRERDMKGLDKSKKHAKKGKLQDRDHEWRREGRKIRAQAQMMKEKHGRKWMGCNKYKRKKWLEKTHPGTLSSDRQHKALTQGETILNLAGTQSDLWASACDFEEGTLLIFLKSGSPWILNVEEYIWKGIFYPCQNTKIGRGLEMYHSV